MAYDEQLADRVRAALSPRDGISERKMFGGLCLMVNGNMACGVMGEEVMVRLTPEDAERATTEPEVRPMDFTGRPMKGMVYVSAAGVAADEDLAGWAEAGADHAASLPPKKPKPAA